MLRRRIFPGASAAWPRLLFLAGFLAAAGADAAPPLPGQSRPGDRPTCRVSSAAVERRVAALRGGRRAPLAPPALSAPRVIVLRVDFIGTSMSATLVDTQGFFQDVRDYYLENSYGVFSPTFTVSPSVYTLGQTMAYYGANSGALCGGTNDVTCGVGELFVDAAAAAAAIDFSAYDHIMVYHAGNGEESTPSSPNNLWSLYLRPVDMVPGSNVLDGTTFDGFTLVPESEGAGAHPLGVICHEYGHQIGLPDLYDTSTGKATIGTWDLMDYPWAGSPQGSNPPHLGAWSKKFLGFGTVQPGATGTITFPAASANANATHRVYTSGSEYFLAEYRSTSAGTYDAALPQPAGIALWHVDDAIAENATILTNNIVNAPAFSGFGHRGIDLVEADGTPANPDADDKGNNNAWTNGQTAASPQTDLYNGGPSSLVLANIAGVGTAAAQATVSFINAASTLEVGRLKGYPNPAGGGRGARAGAPAGTLSTLRFELTRPIAANALRLSIYSLGGRLVRSVGGTGLRFRDDVSTDFNWIYEFDWNGKDELGDEAPSGVYVVHLDADGRLVSGKIAVER